MDEFIKEATAELSKQIIQDDYDQLVRIITYLNKIKDRQAETDGMFKPIQGFMELLKTYGVKFEEDVHALVIVLLNHSRSGLKNSVKIRSKISK